MPDNKRLTPSWMAVVAASMAPFAHADNPFEFPTPVTPVAHETLYVHNLFLVIIAIIFTSGIAFLVYTLYRFHGNHGHKPAAFTGPTTRGQWVLATMPFLALAFIDFFVMGIPAYHAVVAMANTKEDAQLLVKVTGHQWNWEYEYPDEGIRFSSNLSTPQDQVNGQVPKGEHYLQEVDHPLVLPVGEKVRILLASADVIHSWGIPAFGIKQDAVPGFLRETWVKIDTPGVYRGQCGELCGVGHAYMPIVVEAKTPPEFQQWVAQQKAVATVAAAESDMTYTKEQLLVMGKKVFDTKCAVCHQADGQGVPGAFPPIAAGRSFAASPQMLADLAARGFYKDGRIVLGPVGDHADIVLRGISGTSMPAFGGQLSDGDVAAVVTYERNAFGNNTGDVIQPQAVKAARASKQPN